MPLNDYEFQLESTGVLLNQQTNMFPFIDIEKVIGLDNVPYRETVRDHEGADGGFFDAEFEKGRDVILEGVAYCDTSIVETYLDSLKSNFGPVSTPIPFYFKPPGVDERVLFVKPRGAKYDWDLARRIGITNLQLLMYAEDPRIYDNQLLSVSIPYGGPATTGFGFDNITDTFTRSATDDWGTNDTGQAYTETNGSASDFSVNGSVGTILMSTVTTVRFATHSTKTDSEQRIRIKVDQLATGASIITGLVSRWQDSSNQYEASLVFNTTGNIDIRVRTVVAGVGTATTATSIMTHSTTTWYNLLLGTVGTEIRAKGWVDGTAEPATWQVQRTVTDFSTGAIGTRTAATTGNTNTNPTAQFDSHQLPLGFAFNLNFGATVPPSGGTVVVGGNRPAPAVMSLIGPVVNPIIFNLTDSKTLVFTNLTLTGADTLVIDLLNRTVVLNNAVNKRANLTTAEWFLFNTGNTFIVLGGQSGTGSLVIEYRNAWR